MPRKQELDPVQLEASRRAAMKVKAAYYDRYEEMLKQYASPISIDDNQAEKLARKLSSAFQAIKVALVYEGGYPKLRVEPIPRALPDQMGPDYAEREMKALDGYWPTAASVESYVRGFKEGSSETSRLRDELESLKNHEERRFPFPFPMHPSMFRRYFGG